MYQQEAGERVRLLEPNQPRYIRGNRLLAKRKLKEVYLCSILMLVILIALGLTISYAVNFSPADNSNDTLSLTNESDSMPSDVFTVLIENHWPLENQEGRHMENTIVNLKDAVAIGQTFLNQRDEKEKYSPSLAVDSPSFRHQMVMGTSAKARNMSREGYIMEGVSYFVYGSRSEENRKLLCLTNYTNSSLNNICSRLSPEDVCDRFFKYRSYNGTCNNLKFSNTFGVAYRPYRRTLQPDYADGISKPRASKTSEPLPSARTVSLKVHRPYMKSDSKFSVMLAVWGQFLDHDITATALNQKLNGDSISCCQKGTNISPECFPVVLDPNDPFTEFNVTCMEFVRSAPAPQCCLGAREQMNQASAFIDGSVIYGNDESLVQSLRTMNAGQLKMHVTSDKRSLLPVSHDMNDGCNRLEEQKKGRYCFLTGDSRANENLHLTSMHLIWARQHNNIARGLFAINPHWTDETLFQESRKVIAAQMQHITYREFLPLLINNSLLKAHEMLPYSNGYFHKYNESLDASIANEFAAAAFRFAHTLIPALVKFLAEDHSSVQFIQMRKMLFDPFKLYKGGQLEGFLKGAINTSIEASDTYFSNEIKAHLFQRNDTYDASTQKCGLDLVSLNIQRGRDHGLSGYIHFKEHCGFNKTKSFEDLRGIMGHVSLQSIKDTYRHIEAIDLYTGALSEKPLNGSLLGPTLTCLILDQFIRLKFGDRYWYENPYVFDQHQLQEIRKTSLALIICNNADTLDAIQPRVMEGWRKENSNVPCAKIPQLNLDYWREPLPTLRLHTDHFGVNVIT
ncbi:peroxidase isoform X2 [Euwallacea fornicatus]|uniref:peroxidase isoform X2 n=1 Tax=Euwallacea fornicatus TaxID=995702 RepID=UPI00338F0106